MRRGHWQRFLCHLGTTSGMFLGHSYHNFEPKYEKKLPCSVLWCFDKAKSLFDNWLKECLCDRCWMVVKIRLLRHVLIYLPCGQKRRIVRMFSASVSRSHFECLSETNPTVRLVHVCEWYRQLFIKATSITRGTDRVNAVCDQPNPGTTSICAVSSVGTTGFQLCKG